MPHKRAKQLSLLAAPALKKEKKKARGRCHLCRGLHPALLGKIRILYDVWVRLRHCSAMQIFLYDVFFPLYLFCVGYNAEP